MILNEGSTYPLYIKGKTMFCISRLPTKLGALTPPERGHRPVFSEFTNSGSLDAYEAQNEAMDRYMEKYGLEDQDWRHAMMGRMRDVQERRYT